MLNWFSKYRSPFAAKPAKPAAPAAPAAPDPKGQAAGQASAADKAQRKAQARAQQAEQDQAQWAPRLQAALGDDAALLQLALDCPVLALRQTAVEALAGEDALRQAEHAFRSKDRRLHQVAKRRFEAAVLCRESRARADSLIEEARALVAQPLVPVNHLVALDRGWTALDAGLLLPAQAEAFAALRQSLDGVAQDQAERQQRSQRRQQALHQQLASVQAAGQAWLVATEAAAAAAAGPAAGPAGDAAGDPVADPAAAAEPSPTPETDHAAALEAACAALRHLVDDADGPALDPRQAAAAAAMLQDADALRQRLHWLARPAPARPRPVAAPVVSAEPEAPALPADASPADALPAAADASPTADAEPVADALPSADPAPMADAVPAADAAPVADLTPAAEPSPAAVAANPSDATTAATADAAAQPAPSWASLPVVAHAPWADALARLHVARQRPARTPAPAARAAAAPADRPARRAGPAPLTPAQRDALAQRLQQAEAALADGHLAPLQQQLQAVEQALAQGAPLAPADPLAQRTAALMAEHQRLKSWQQWGGGRARDDLAAEAEVLARATAAAADPALADAPKLDLKAHADAITALRGRWRELDRLGAAASQALWQRFDTALKAAYQPVGERQAAQKAQRLQNQQEREALLAALEAWPGQPPAAGAAPGTAPTEAAAPPADGPAKPADATSADATHAAGDTPQGNGPDADEPTPSGSWKDRQRAIDRFQTAWRQLGPLEHTVPAAAREPLRQRQQQVLARLEAPLQQARREAVARREALIQQAEALAARAAAGLATAPGADAGRRGGFGDGPRRAGPDDLAQQVRQLQADWQQQARELSLPRGLEATLWGRFRAALDAVFAQRQAVFQARDAASAAQQAEREGLIARLSALPADAPAADVRRVLAEVDQAWRAPMDLPRGHAIALDNQYRDARAALQQRLAGAVARQWQAWCDALAKGVQQAQRREQGEVQAGEAGAADARPADLPAAWAQALADRAGAVLAAGPLSAEAFDARLLVLEAALDMPASAEQQAARRLLKLQALKQTLEGRAAPAAAPVAPADALLAALRQQQLPPAQQQRVLAVLAALRQATPGVAGLPVPRA